MAASKLSPKFYINPKLTPSPKPDRLRLIRPLITSTTIVMPQVSKKRLHENLTLRFYQIISDGAGALEIVSLLLPILRC